MKLNMICIKFHQKIKKTKKPTFWTFEVFRFFLLSKPFSSHGIFTCTAAVENIQSASLECAYYFLTM